MAGGRRGAGLFKGMIAGVMVSGGCLAALSLSLPVGAPKPAAQAAPRPVTSSPAQAAVLAAPAPTPSAAPAPPAAPVPPAWRRNGAAFDAGIAGPTVAVALLDVETQPALAERALASGAATLVIAPSAPGALSLGARARAQGLEVFLLGAAGSIPWAAGSAMRGFPAAARAAVAAAGLAALELDPAGAAAPGPSVRADFGLEAGASAERVFQTLDEAARRAAPGGVAVVALSVSEASLTGLSRWRAVATARLAPATAAIRP